MKLVSNWRAAPKWFSNWAHAVNVAFLATWATIPDKIQDAIPLWLLLAIAILLIALGVFARLVDQGTGSGE